jgi:hypothetical protein
MKKTCFEIENDSFYSTIEEISIYNLSGEKRIVDEICYFSTKAKAKKALIQQFKYDIENYKCAIKRIKETI